MKRLFLVFVLGMCAQWMQAEGLSVKPVSVPLAGQADLEIHYTFDAAEKYSGYQFTLMLPEGVEVVVKNSEAVLTKGECHTGSHMVSYNYVASTRENMLVGFSTTSAPLSGTEGLLLKVKIQANDALNVGDVLSGRIEGVAFGTTDAVSVKFADVDFQVTIAEEADPWITLDENSTVLPEATDDEVEIKVIRTLKANVWNTVCFPFEIDRALKKEIFGDDVKVAEFAGYEWYDDESGVEVYFDNLIARKNMVANTPYLIKVSQDIREFMITAVIEPNVEDAVVEGEQGLFYGTLVAGGKVPANCLFLSGGQFWYSTGNSNIKAFRGYFEFEDVLAVPESAQTKMMIVLRDETTGVKEVIGRQEQEAYYDLQGRRVPQPKKGLYLQKGRKIIIK